MIEGVSRLAHKESDRAITLQQEFGKLGGHYLRINPEVGGIGGRGTRSPLDGFERSPELFGRG